MCPGQVLYVGDEGYIKMADEVTQVAKKMAEIVNGIPELRLLATPDCAIVPITTVKGTTFTIYQVASLLEASGWNMFTGQHPAVMSACIGEQHLRVVEDWGADLHCAIKKLRRDPVQTLNTLVPTNQPTKFLLVAVAKIDIVRMVEH